MMQTKKQGLRLQVGTKEKSYRVGGATNGYGESGKLYKKGNEQEEWLLFLRILTAGVRIEETVRCQIVRRVDRSLRHSVFCLLRIDLNSLTAVFLTRLDEVASMTGDAGLGAGGENGGAGGSEEDGRVGEEDCTVKKSQLE
jgi:hypothetical protein